MIQKKICMLGAFAVGKTSLVSRFVKSIFSEKYQTTVGVKIDKKVVNVGDTEVMLMLWDLAGEDEFNKIQTSYLRGSAGYILVADGTRAATLDKALSLRQTVETNVGILPFIIIVNKADLVDDWEIDSSTLNNLSQQGITIIKGSAKTGEGVEETFFTLARQMVGA